MIRIGRRVSELPAMGKTTTNKQTDRQTKVEYKRLYVCTQSAEKVSGVMVDSNRVRVPFG